MEKRSKPRRPARRLHLAARLSREFAACGATGESAPSSYDKNEGTKRRRSKYAVKHERRETWSVGGWIIEAVNEIKDRGTQTDAENCKQGEGVATKLAPLSGSSRPE